ncbi:MAG: ATP-binding protein, partial [Candidatus Angelobacter sp.]
MTTPQVLTAATICTSFPEMPQPTIARENLLVALETMLNGDLQMIILEGEEGVGKTTLLAQFARRNSEHTVSVFIRPTSWYTSDPEILTSDLINQMNWIVSSKEIPSREAMGTALLRRSVYELMRFSGRTSKKIVFVVDGLTAIPAERRFSRDAILELIPFGYPQFKFIFSGKSEELAGLKPLAHMVWKTFQVPPFSRDEARALFGTEVSQTFIDDIYSVCKGLPGYFATIQRLLKSGAKPEELATDLPTSLPQLFDLEWKTVDRSNSLQIEIVAFLAHDKNSHSLADLEVLFRHPQHDITASLKELSFVTIPANSTAPVQFVSDAFRTYAAQQLSRESRVVVDRVVDSLLSQPESVVALKFLPTYLSETARHQSLLEYLSPDRFERMLAMTEQLTPLQRTIELGFRTAQKLNKDEELFRFGVQSSTVAELNGF